LQNPDLTKRLLTTKNLILLANLPYLPDSDRPLKGLHNISYEPDLALFSGSDGLDLFRRLLLELSDLQFQPECLVFELDPRNIRLASELVFKQLRWATYCDLQIWSDSNGLDRCLIFRNHQAG
jgi:release factor glutamine methyltransferase